MSDTKKSESVAASQANGSEEIRFGTFSPQDLQIEPKVALPQRSQQTAAQAAQPTPSHKNGFSVKSLLPKGVKLESIIKWNGENEWTFVDDGIQIGRREEKKQQAKATNWAKLFNAPQTTTTKPQKAPQPAEKKEEKPLLSVEEALQLLGKGEELVLEPRGLVNERNKCFMNVVLQVLVASPPFLSLLACLSRARIPHNAHVLASFVKLLEEFGVPTVKGTPLSPKYFHPLLSRFNPKYGTQHVYQEDAQEFLSFLLDRMHEELLAVTKSRSVPFHQEERPAEEDWQEVGKGNKTSIIVTKEEAFAASPITSIFGGKLRISLKKHNSKSSVSIQPFFCLHLDIQHPGVHTLEDALEFFSTKEYLEGVTDSANLEVAASKHTTLESLPKILIFHLKRFSFDEGTQKLGKFVSFPENLTIKPHLVAAKAQASQRKYQLLAVVSHLGTHATNGHYTCDVKQQGKWIHFDDTTVYKTTEEQVASRIAYILVYQQCK